MKRTPKNDAVFLAFTSVMSFSQWGQMGVLVSVSVHLIMPDLLRPGFALRHYKASPSL